MSDDWTSPTKAAEPPTDEVTNFIISQMVRLDTSAMIRIRDNLAEALARPKPWKRDTDLRRIREALDDEIAVRSRATPPAATRA
jgi:hypothetical protein